MAAITCVYLQRVQLLLLVHPTSLARMQIPKNAVQLRNEWPLDPKASTLRSIQTINWSIEHMAALCADKDTYERIRQMKALAVAPKDGQDFSPETATNMYRLVQAGTAQRMIDEISKRRELFCRNDYGVAVYDARIAGSFYAQRSSNNFLTVAKRQDEMIRLLNSIKEKNISSNGGLVQLTEDEQRLSNCIKEIPPSDAKLLFRCYSTSKGEDTMDEEVNFLPDPQRPSSVPSLEQGAYVSPDIDIRAYCREIHGTNYTIRDVCERVEEEARTAIRSMSVPVEIARECDRIHDSYSIRQVCYRNEIAAKERLGG